VNPKHEIPYAGLVMMTSNVFHRPYTKLCFIKVT